MPPSKIHTSSRPEKSVNPLDKYFQILKGKIPPKFRICKKIEARFSGENKDELWNSHEKAMQKYRKIEKRIHENEVKLSNFETPEKSLLDLKIEIAENILKSCEFCERKCQINRLEGEEGICGVGENPNISSNFIHTGEERELVPSYTIFFSGCTFKCQYCQNWGISQRPERGKYIKPKKIAEILKERKKAEEVINVNWVGGDPTSALHYVMKSLKELEVNVPSVWNSNMYLSKKSMKLLQGTQDIYLTDFKYGNNECGKKYSKINNYWEITTRNHKIAHENTEIIIRHLVLPNHQECCTEPILKWIKEELGPDTRVNILGQYRPEAKSKKFPELQSRINPGKIHEIKEFANQIGLKHI